MYISMIFNFFSFFGCFHLVIHKNEGIGVIKPFVLHSRTFKIVKKSTIEIDGEPLPYIRYRNTCIIDTEIFF